MNVDVLVAQSLQNCFGYPEVVVVVVVVVGVGVGVGVVVVVVTNIIHRLLFNSMSYLFNILRAPYTQQKSTQAPQHLQKRYTSVVKAGL